MPEPVLFAGGMTVSAYGRKRTAGAIGAGVAISRAIQSNTFENAGECPLLRLANTWAGNLKYGETGHARHRQNGNRGQQTHRRIYGKAKGVPS